MSTKSSVLKESDDGCAQCQKKREKNILNEVIALWTGKHTGRKSHVSILHEQTPKNTWGEGKDRVEGKKKLGILWTHRHASKQQVSCESAVGESMYMCVDRLHTLWTAVCQWLGERGGGYVQVIGGSREPYFMWASLSLGGNILHEYITVCRLQSLWGEHSRDTGEPE